MSKRGMLSTTVAPLAAILVIIAAVPAIAAEPKNDGGACDERSFAPDDATLRVSRATGIGRIRVLGGTAPIVPGQALLLGASRPGYVCALFASGLEARAGWVPQRRIAPAALSVDPAPPLAAWVGTWRQYDNKIVLIRVGDRDRPEAGFLEQISASSMRDSSRYTMPISWAEAGRARSAGSPGLCGDCLIDHFCEQR